MFSRIHNKLGSAGLVVAVIALVAALAGTAFAAAKLNGTQKKEVEKIAKKFAGKPGKPGAPGPQGSPGPKGDTGSKGDAGTAGAPGANGKSVVTGTLSPGQGGCSEGGITVEVEGSGVKKSVCTGEEGEQGPPGPEGSPWVAGTAPAGVVMKGTWVLPPATAAAEGDEFFVPVSTGVPIHQKSSENEPLAVFGEGPPFCSGSAADPKPPVHPVTGDVLPGAVCVYSAASNGIGGPLNESKLRESGGGVVVAFKSTGAGAVSGYGSWAMGTP